MCWPEISGRKCRKWGLRLGRLGVGGGFAGEARARGRGLRSRILDCGRERPSRNWRARLRALCGCSGGRRFLLWVLGCGGRCLGSARYVSDGLSCFVSRVLEARVAWRVTRYAELLRDVSQISHACMTRLTSLSLLRHQIKNRRSRRLRPRSRSSGNCNQRFQTPSNRLPCPQRRIHKVKELGVGKGGVEIHQLGGVDDAAAAYSQKSVGLVGLGEVDGFFDAVGRCAS